MDGKTLKTLGMVASVTGFIVGMASDTIAEKKQERYIDKTIDEKLSNYFNDDKED